MINHELTRAFERIADLLEITGANSFRVNSYRRAARTIKETPDDLAVVATEDCLDKLPGIGKSTAEKIRQYLERGRIDLLDELSAQLPEGLPDLLNVPGLGPKKVAVLHERLSVGSLDDLKAAITADRLKELPGFGPKSAARISEGLVMLESLSERTPLGLALPIAEGLIEALAGRPDVDRIEVAGSLRRAVETVGDVDLVCAGESGEAIIRAFTELPSVRRVISAGATKGSVTVDTHDGRELRVQLRVVPPDSYGAALQYFTGSKEHNVRLRELAAKRGWKLSEWGLFDGDQAIAGDHEAGIYERLGLPALSPELREDRGEFDPDFDPSALIDLEHIRGDLHLHTTASDGRFSAEEMAREAKTLGYRYIAVTDHSRSSGIANGLTLDRLQKQLRDLRKLDNKLRSFTVLTGTECDILADGSLDYPDEILADCDWVVASIHSALTGGRVSPTERTIRAMQNKYVCAIGHPTGRLLGQRAPMDLDMTAVIQAAAETGTALEINASWQRLDLKDVHVRQALDAGVMLTINTDAHHTDMYEEMRFGVLTARRGGATPDRVLNTFTIAELRKWIERKRI